MMILRMYDRNVNMFFTNMFNINFTLLIMYNFLNNFVSYITPVKVELNNNIYVLTLLILTFPLLKEGTVVLEHPSLSHYMPGPALFYTHS